MKIRCNNCHNYADIPFFKIGREQELCCNCGRYFYGTELKTIKTVRAIVSTIPFALVVIGVVQALKTRGYSTLETFLIQLAIIFPVAFLANTGLWIYIKARNHTIEKHDINSEN